MSGDEGRVAPLARLIASGEPAAVGGVGLDDPEFRMVTLDVIVSVDAPHFVGSADKIYAELRPDVRRVVQRLREILDAAPHEHMERSRIGAPRTAHDPVGAFRRHADPGRPGTVERALFRHRAQRLGRGVADRVGLQVGIVALIVGDDLKDVLLATWAVRR